MSRLVLLALIITGRFRGRGGEELQRVALKLARDAFRGRRGLGEREGERREQARKLQMERRKGQCRDSLLAGRQNGDTLGSPAIGLMNGRLRQDNAFSSRH